MAIYHLEAKAITRSAGRSATAAAAYRAGIKLHDARTDMTWDFSRKKGIFSSDIILPSHMQNAKWALDRSALWNAAESAEKRKDSCTAKEIIVAIPHELTREQGRALIIRFAKSICDEEGCAIDAAGHEPNKIGDDRNIHYHLMKTVRTIGFDNLGGKLETEKSGRKRKDDLNLLREKWANMANQALAEAGQQSTIDHRSNKARGISEQPGQHLGPIASAIERKGRKSRRGDASHQANSDAALDAEIKALEARKIQLEKERQDETRRMDLQRKFQQQRADSVQQETLKILEETKRSAITINGIQNSNTPGRETPLFRPWRAPDGVVVYLARKPNVHGKKAAFSDRGNRLKVHMAEDKDAMRAAMQLAKEKWPGGITITGDRAFREAAEKEAERIGLHVQNKLQPPKPENRPTARFRI